MRNSRIDCVRSGAGPVGEPLAGSHQPGADPESYPDSLPGADCHADSHADARRGARANRRTTRSGSCAAAGTSVLS
ncbi:hypothetical protein I6N91_08915 [Arthrobacter sp. MSA 4-2]|uniref:hypothetical protein n=1 Tax=Arthrobacter sp. MSA 4-2 TaxID=2794349 RepID=UPI0018E7CFF3|nr:hypothetical protein [Arthrobacter sp. MSA 4-2]MBJ2121097.1 hypothetical protein [Arthrobacter sp. MSA 4-2]